LSNPKILNTIPMPLRRHTPHPLVSNVLSMTIANIPFDARSTLTTVNVTEHRGCNDTGSRQRSTFNFRNEA
jgi:hypothetical protein